MHGHAPERIIDPPLLDAISRAGRYSPPPR
jgi:hypothetical protein